MNEVQQTNDLSHGSGLSLRGLREHDLRATLIGELHTRPFAPISVPRQFCHFAFLTDEATQQSDLAALRNIIKASGRAPPTLHDSYLRADFGSWDLRWEQHTEFTTCRWGTAPEGDAVFSAPPEFAFKPSGELLVAVLLSITNDDVSGSQVSRRRVQKFYSGRLNSLRRLGSIGSSRPYQSKQILFS